ncbi:acetyl-CoA carboxylase biotin carboxylase subunit [Bdellovibrionota bacterium]
MFKKVLIANRGEIALRVMRTCKELGIKTVAIHSDVDAEAMHVKLADESVCIGPGSPKLSYLNIVAILSAAEVTGADAIHPGYGFLSENETFADICQKCGITFIGPSLENMRRMGNKIHAKEIMRNGGVPCLPGSRTPLNSIEEAKNIAKQIEYPVIFKASGGGGGRGMAIVEEPSEIESSFWRVKAEAEAAFGDGRIYLERFLTNPRHIEIQVLCDQHGNQIHLGERDCTLQRRHQKVLEEATCPYIGEEMRAKMIDAALGAAEEVQYQNVGTIEFLVENNEFYFMEMNTRIQVEHTVTEMVTGIDIIKEQILASAGYPLSIKQKDVNFRGHSIQCRINAEDPLTFNPSPGKIGTYHPPGGYGVRVESALYNNYTVLPHYDSLIAKLIVHAETRQEAINRMQRALDEFIINGISTNISFHQKLLKHPAFHEGGYNTRFLETTFNS